MTNNGLMFLSEAKFDIDQLKVNCESGKEEQLVSKLEDTIDELRSMQDSYYNRRKDEVVTKSPSHPTNL